MISKFFLLDKILRKNKVNIQVLLLLIMLTVVGGAMTACDVNQGPAEKAGENIDKAVDDAGDALEDAGETIKEKMK